MDREGSADRSAGMFLIYCYAGICHSAAERIFIPAFASADGKDGRSNGSGRLSDIAFDGVAVYILAGCVRVQIPEKDGNHFNQAKRSWASILYQLVIKLDISKAYMISIYCYF